MRHYMYILLVVVLSACQPEKTKDEWLREDRAELAEELKAMEETDQKNRLLLRALKKQQLPDSIYKKKSDSIWAIQTPIDKKNTERLIEITKKYGFPRVSRLGAPIGVWIIFQHSAEEYREELSQLLAEEHKAGRLPDIEYEMLKWHLGGRKGIPLEALQSKGIEVKVSDSIKK